MRAKPGNLKELDKYFDFEKDYDMTEDELEKVTFGSLSKNLYYVKKQFSFAKKNHVKMVLY